MKFIFFPLDEQQRFQTWPLTTAMIAELVSAVKHISLRFYCFHEYCLSHCLTPFSTSLPTCSIFLSFASNLLKLTNLLEENVLHSHSGENKQTNNFLLVK